MLRCSCLLRRVSNHRLVSVHGGCVLTRKIRHRVGNEETILVARYLKTGVSTATAPRKYGTVLVFERMTVRGSNCPAPRGRGQLGRVAWVVGWMGATLSFQPRGLPSRHEPQCPHNTHSHVCSFGHISSACCSVCVIRAVSHKICPLSSFPVVLSSRQITQLWFPK